MEGKLHTLVRDENHLRQLIGAAAGGDGEACFWIAYYYHMEVSKLKKDNSENTEARVSELEEKEFEYFMKGATLRSPKIGDCQEGLTEYYAGKGNKAEALRWAREAVSNGNDLTFWVESLAKEVEGNTKPAQQSTPKTSTPKTSTNSGCYIATAVYGSYDCPEVWTLRRFRDSTLAATWYGRAFIRIYYATSPNLVKLFGNNPKVMSFVKPKLDKFVAKLTGSGVENIFYKD